MPDRMPCQDDASGAHQVTGFLVTAFLVIRDRLRRGADVSPLPRRLHKLSLNRGCMSVHVGCGLYTRRVPTRLLP